MSEPPSLLTFPTDYPIKVIGRPSDEFRARVHAIVMQHVPDLQPDQVSERSSENGRYLSLSFLIRAQSREQIIALTSVLKSCSGVLMLL